MQKQGPKHQLFEQFAQVAKALSHAHKLELLELPAQGERSVEVLANVAGLTIAKRSRKSSRTAVGNIVYSLLRQ